MNQRLFKRNGYFYIDSQNDGERVRMATSLKVSAESKAFLAKKGIFELFLKDKKAALMKWRDFSDKAWDKANLPKERKGAKNKDFDIKSLLDEMLYEKDFLRLGTRKNNSCGVKMLLNFLDSVGVFDITKLKREHCVDYARYLKDERKLKTSSLKNRMQTLNQLLKLALQKDLIAKNPFFLPKMSDEEELSIQKPFSLDEVQSLIKAAKGELKTYLIVAFFTGARTGEILGLKWEDIDFKNDEIHIQRTKFPNGRVGLPKTKSSKRVIDMLSLVKAELVGIKGENKTDDFIFKATRDTIKSHFKALCESLGLETRRLYDSRHTFASVMLSKGEEPMWVGVKMMGHKDLNTTFKIYAKFLPQKVSERAKFLNELDLDNEKSLFERGAV